MAEQGIQAWFAAAEGFEGFGCTARTADGQYFFPEAAAGFGNVVAFFKSGVSVCTQNFRPCVAVIACGVAAGEDVAEA